MVLMVKAICIITGKNVSFQPWGLFTSGTCISRAPWLREFGYLSIWEILVVTVPSSDHPSEPQGNQYEISYFLASMETLLHIPIVVNWQLSKQGIPWSVSYDHIADPLRLCVFLKLSANKFINGSFAFSLGLIYLLHPLWNHWLSMQSDWLSAVWFIPKSHHFLL